MTTPDRPHDLTQPDHPASPEATTRPRLTEDWAATVVGLALLALVLAGVIGPGVIP